jgi:hypothetical protein
MKKRFAIEVMREAAGKFDPDEVIEEGFENVFLHPLGGRRQKRQGLRTVRARTIAVRVELALHDAYGLAKAVPVRFRSIDSPDLHHRVSLLGLLESSRGRRPSPAAHGRRQPT